MLAIIAYNRGDSDATGAKNELGKIRKLHPGNWVVVHALDGRTEKGQRIITQFALMDVCGDDWKEAWERYKELHAADKWQEYYVLHTDREELDIGVMDAFGRKVMDE